MKASYILISKIKEFEGFRSQAYKCPAGVWTIGYGHTADVKPGDKISEAEAERLLRKDLIHYEAFVESLNVSQKQEKFDALVDFAYNLGCAALEGSTLLKQIRACRPDKEIRIEFMRWVYSGKKKLPGLVIRRKWEADRYFNLV
ncbi:MAG: lysozyme [Candidatus Paraprevotella stercoravium]|uniref:Lysozyme n=1 Tax=Candidatus Paraprevotella stercoravium TaxID=2838725 RepID=A0A9E2P236_9BACT|nr:lysozyme [Candidatus Paraprevotella stercoravium]